MARPSLRFGGIGEGGDGDHGEADAAPGPPPPPPFRGTVASGAHGG